MDAFFFHDIFGQRSSTPKSGKLNGHANLFNANESAILELESEASSSEKPPKPVHLPVPQKTPHKRRLFEDIGAGICFGGRPTSQAIMPSPKKPALEGRQNNRPKKKSPTSLKAFCGLTTPGPEDRQRLPPSWNVQQKMAFFEAVRQYGNDFAAIAHKMKELLESALGNRAKSQSEVEVEAYFNTIVRRVLKDQSLKTPDERHAFKLYDERDAFQIYAVVNFGAWSQQLGEKSLKNDDLLHFKELFSSGKVMFEKTTRRKQTDVPTKLSQLFEGPFVTSRTRFHVKTPDCPALQRLHLSEHAAQVPPMVLMHLRPRSAVSWQNVQKSCRSPVLSVNVNTTWTLKNLFDFLRIHWHFERKEKRYLNAETPSLFLRPDGQAVLNWPAVMPDFSVLRSHSFCWLAYDRFVKRFPTLLNDSPDSDKPALPKQTYNRYLDEDANLVFFEENESDDDEVETTIVNEGPAPVKDPRAAFRKFFDDNGHVVWSSAQHQHVPIAELFMIAGKDGQLHLNYDWIIPEEERLDVPENIFNMTKVSSTLAEILQLDHPREDRMLHPVIDLCDSPIKDPKCHNLLPGASNVIIHPVSLAAPLVSSCERKELPVDPGVHVLDGETLSEFIIPNTASAFNPVAQDSEMVVSTVSNVSGNVPVYSFQTPVIPNMYNTRNLQQNQDVIFISQSVNNSNGEIRLVPAANLQQFTQVNNCAQVVQMPLKQTLFLNNHGQLTQGFIVEGQGQFQQNFNNFATQGTYINNQQVCFSVPTVPIGTQNTPIFINCNGQDQQQLSYHAGESKKGRPRKNVNVPKPSKSATKILLPKNPCAQR